MVYTEHAEKAAVSRDTSQVTTKQRCNLHHLGGYSKTRYKKASHSFRITCDKSAASLLESREQRYIKEINNKNKRYKVPDEIKRSRDQEEGGGAGPSS